MTKQCTSCGIELTNRTWNASNTKRDHRICKVCGAAETAKWRKDNPEKTKSGEERSRIKQGHIPMNINKSCSAFLGIHVAEQVLSKVFKDVTRMQYGNQGFDFVCNRGKKIDVKSSSMRIHRKRNPQWHFSIKHNKIADFFLCIAFDNRKSLTPLHLWLLPGELVSMKGSTSISTDTIDKWNEHKLDINKVVKCCDTMRRN